MLVLLLCVSRVEIIIVSSVDFVILVIIVLAFVIGGIRDISVSVY